MTRITSIAHVISGLITAMSAIINPVLAILAFLTFIIYELDEDWHISDQAWKDIKEYGIGLYIGITILLLHALTPLL